jgi:hypothetical protein
MTHIAKTDFLKAFKAAYYTAITKENIKAGFHGAGLVPLNPDAVLSKMDIRLHTPTPPPANITEWTSQTPYNPAEAIAQSALVRKQLNEREGSPTPLIRAVSSLVKGTEQLAQEMAIIQSEIHALREANCMLSKRRKKKNVQLQHGGTLTVQQGLDLILQKENGVENQPEMVSEEGMVQPEASSSRCCSKCGKPGHNTRTCPDALIDPVLLVSE